MLVNECIYSSVTSGRLLMHIVVTKSIFCIISGMYDVIYNDPLKYDIHFLFVWIYHVVYKPGENPLFASMDHILLQCAAVQYKTQHLYLYNPYKWNNIIILFLINDNFNIIFLRKYLKKAFSDLQDITNTIEGLTITIRIYRPFLIQIFIWCISLNTDANVNIPKKSTTGYYKINYFIRYFC